MAPPSSSERLLVPLPRPLSGVRPAGQARGIPADSYAEFLQERRELAAASRRLAADGEALRSILAGLAAEAERLPGLVAERLGQWRPFLVELALKLAERVLHTALARGDYDLEPVVSELLERARNRVAARELLVLLHPADLSAVLGRLRAGGGGLALDPAVRFETSPRMARGGCQVQTEAGRLSFDPAEFLAEAAALVREELGDDRALPGQA